MRFQIMIGLVLIATLLAVNQGAKLPSHFQLCHLWKPGSNKCLRQGIEEAIKTLGNGSKQIGIPPFEPLEIPELYIGAGSGPVNVAQHFKDVKLYGLIDVKILNGSVDHNETSLLATSFHPELRLEAQYDMKGRVLLLPIVGNGPCNVTLVNVKVGLNLILEKYEKKGNTHYKVTDLPITINPEKVIFKFDNLFDGDKRLGTEINNVLNENSVEVFADVRSGYEASLSVIFKDLANRVFSRVPIKYITLE